MEKRCIEHVFEYMRCPGMLNGYPQPGARPVSLLGIKVAAARLGFFRFGVAVSTACGGGARGLGLAPTGERIVAQPARLVARLQRIKHRA